MENEHLSHADIWDDSSLINAWDSALQEYKKYHSIQAMGGNVESAIAATNAPGEIDMKDDDASVQGAQSSGKSLLQGQGEGEKGSEKGDMDENLQAPGDSVSAQKKQTEHQPQVSAEPNQENVTSPKMPSIPQGLLAGENEALRNLMISWYFAGYYTGLYEGQQMQQRSQR